MPDRRHSPSTFRATNCIPPRAFSPTKTETVPPGIGVMDRTGNDVCRSTCCRINDWSDSDNVATREAARWRMHPQIPAAVTANMTAKNKLRRRRMCDSSAHTAFPRFRTTRDNPSIGFQHLTRFTLGSARCPNFGIDVGAGLNETIARPEPDVLLKSVIGHSVGDSTDLLVNSSLFGVPQRERSRSPSMRIDELPIVNVLHELRGQSMRSDGRIRRRRRSRVANAVLMNISGFPAASPSSVSACGMSHTGAICTYRQAPTDCFSRDTPSSDTDPACMGRSPGFPGSPPASASASSA